MALRPRSVAQQLRADWLGEHVRLAVADHLFVEIRDGTDSDERKRQRVAADAFRLAATPRATWWPVYQQLLAVRPKAPAKDRNDLIHVAQSIALGGRWLITTDGPLAKRYGAAAADLGLRIVSPSAFFREVDEQARGDRYRPVDLAGTSVTRREVDACALPKLAETFVNHQQDERLRDLRQRIDVAAARPAAVRLEVIQVDREPRGLVAWQIVDGALEVVLLRATTGRGETTIGRHLLALMRDQAVDLGVETIRVVDPTPSATVQRSFRDEGFAGSPIVAHALVGRGTLAELRQRGAALGSPLADGRNVGDHPEDLLVRAAAAERWFAPVRVLGIAIPAFVVPIRHGWATRLLDVGLSEDQLFPRDWGLGLRRELVYYRSPRNAGGLAAPARLLWYVSGTAPGAGSIRAVSHLTEVAVGDQDRLFHRFQPLGVYSREDVHARADGRGRVMALRFCRTERFDEPVSLDDYRRLVAGNPKSRSVILRSARRVSEHVFVSLLEMGFPDGR